MVPGRFVCVCVCVACAFFGALRVCNCFGCTFREFVCDNAPAFCQAPVCVALHFVCGVAIHVNLNSSCTNCILLLASCNRDAYIIQHGFGIHRLMNCYAKQGFPDLHVHSTCKKTCEIYQTRHWQHMHIHPKKTIVYRCAELSWAVRICPRIVRL